ncbi:ParA family protein [Sedimentibacter sp. zth1]|uniref:ParA family protein n=1 Tax=Sedimentibacter sp. zth1 TaxID=2816908 RepID=UPI001A90EB53|nr:AAA family ATPase [Sedimentibacter sp. zth1]QSX07178.1 ParA family protein [Sedimentibacter sp. zth1]
MAKTICVTNQKGGVAKTTTSNAIGLGFKKKGYKVLLIDLDPQGNLSFSVKAEVDESATIYDVLKGDVSVHDAIQKTEIIDIIPSNIILSGVDLEFTHTGREFLLKEALSSVQNEYDYIVIDTPPSLNILTINAFAVADCIIIPMLADIFSLQGITQLYETITRVKKYCNPAIKIEGILLTRYNPRLILSSEIRETAEMIAQQLGTTIFDTYIRASVSIQEVHTQQEDMYKYASRNNAVKDYMNFVKELITRGI